MMGEGNKVATVPIRSIKIDLEGPRRTKKDPVMLSKLRQTSQAASPASSFSSCFFFRNMFVENTYTDKYLLKILFQKLIFWKYFCLMPPLSTVSSTLCWADLDVRRPGASHTIIIRLLTVRCQRCPGPGSSCRLGQHTGTRLLVVLSFKRRFAKIP